MLFHNYHVHKIVLKTILKVFKRHHIFKEAIQKTFKDTWLLTIAG